MKTSTLVLNCEEDLNSMSEKLTLSNYLLNEAEKIAKLGHWQWNLATGDIIWSNNLFNIFEVENRKSMTFELFISLIHPEDRESVKNHITSFLKTKVFKEFYHRVISPGGTIKILHARGEIILDENGNLCKMIGTSQDVTERKKTEQELCIKARELESKNEELQKFAYIASHDMQEPLRKLTVFCSMLEENCRETLDKKSRLYITKIVDCATRMRDLISRILQISNISTGNKFTRVNLNNILNTVLSDLETTIQDKKAVVRTEKLPVIEANETQIYQLLMNLVSNAIKFHRPGLVPFVEISATIVNGTELESFGTENILPPSTLHETEKYCCLRISDQGTGFDESKAGKMFIPFHTLHKRSEFNGNGIGLSIVKKIIENHKGFISVKSRAGHGSCFLVNLPVKQV